MKCDHTIQVESANGSMATSEPKTPEPGIYHDVPFGEYAAWKCVNNSRLSLLSKSPAHYKTYEPTRQSKALAIGSLVHAGRLEPMAIAAQYAVVPDYHLDVSNQTSNGDRSESKATKYVRYKVADFIAANEGKQIVSAEWYREATAIVESLYRNPEANQIFNDEGETELSLVWDDPETGLRCKARLDKLCKSLVRIADLKTTPDILKFHKSIGNYGYHRQLAFYQRGWSILTGELLEPWIVAIEKQPPYVCHSAPFGDDDIEDGDMAVTDLLDTLANCIAKDDWPGPRLPERWTVPEWAKDSEPVALVIGGETVEI